jgi:hypothetical protein
MRMRLAGRLKMEIKKDLQSGLEMWYYVIPADKLDARNDRSC